MGQFFSWWPLYRVLLPMKDLHTLGLLQCSNPHIFIHILHSSVSSSGAVVCPRLEEVFIGHGLVFDIKEVVGMVAARVSIGVKLKLVKLVPMSKVVYSPLEVLELKKHVLHVEMPFLGR